MRKLLFRVNAKEDIPLVKYLIKLYKYECKKIDCNTRKGNLDKYLYNETQDDSIQESVDYAFSAYMISSVRKLGNIRQEYCYKNSNRNGSCGMGIQMGSYICCELEFIEIDSKTSYSKLPIKENIYKESNANLEVKFELGSASEGEVKDTRYGGIFGRFFSWDNFSGLNNFSGFLCEDNEEEYEWASNIKEFKDLAHIRKILNSFINKYSKLGNLLDGEYVDSDDLKNFTKEFENLISKIIDIEKGLEFLVGDCSGVSVKRELLEKINEAFLKNDGYKFVDIIKKNYERIMSIVNELNIYFERLGGEELNLYTWILKIALIILDFFVSSLCIFLRLLLYAMFYRAYCLKRELLSENSSKDPNYKELNESIIEAISRSAISYLLEYNGNKNSKKFGFYSLKKPRSKENTNNSGYNIPQNVYHYIDKGNRINDVIDNMLSEALNDCNENQDEDNSNSNKIDPQNTDVPEEENKTTNTKKQASQTNNTNFESIINSMKVIKAIITSFSFLYKRDFFLLQNESPEGTEINNLVYNLRHFSAFFSEDEGSNPVDSDNEQKSDEVIYNESESSFAVRQRKNKIKFNNNRSINQILI